MQQETRYSDDPSAMASHWESQGAQCLHVVDLNGAVEGQPQNLEHIAAIVKKVSIPVQVGGGIRSLDTIRDYLSRGIQWVVLGTAILDNPDLLAQACSEFPSRILVGVDVKQGKVAVRGWTDVAEIGPEDFLSSLSPYAIAGVVFTEISRDGMLVGPNIPALQMAVTSSAFPVIASGGITRVEDIHSVKTLGEKISGVIIGKALYEGTIDLPAAIEAASAS